MHLLQIIHTNLKPTNIQISSPKGAVKALVKLTDFGLSFISNKEDGNDGWSAVADQVITSASDILSLGCVMAFRLVSSPLRT